MSDTILVLDDEQAYAEMLRELLTDRGFHAEVSTDPKKALERLHERSYALIVSDFKMPDVDGAQFLVEARRIIPQLPVIMVSGLMTTPDLLKVANIGVTLVLEKPFNVDVFLEYVRRFVTPENEVAEEATAEGEAPETSDSEAAASGEESPPPLKYLVDDSSPSREFVQALWSAYRNGARHLFLQLPPGGEFSEAVKEIAAWRGAPGLTSFHFSLLELDTPEVRRTLRELAAAEVASPSVAVTLPDHAHFDGEVLARFVQWIDTEPQIRERFVFVYGVPLEADFGALFADERVNGALGGPIRMQPLRERLTDLAAYMSRFLAAIPRHTPRSLAPDAATTLLHYDWPGNHRELLSVLRRAFNMAPGDVVTREHVQTAIRSRHGDMQEGGMKLNLESFLLIEQRRFLRSHAAAGADLKSISDLAGVGPDRLRSGKRADEQPLLFPELLEGEDATERGDHHG